MNKILKYQGAGKLVSLLDDIVKAAKRSPIDFSDWGKLHRADMLKIPGNKSIVSKLSDSELGYLLYHRNGQILNGTGSRYAIFNGSDPMSVKRINLFDNPNWNTGYLIPEYIDVVPETVSTHYVENLTGGLTKGVSEDLYNALINITEKPISANRIWKMPEITEKVYKKFTPGISNPQFKMMQHKLIDQVGSSGKPAGWSSQKWQEELEWMKKRADIDAGIQDGDELFNTVDDFYEDVMRTPVEVTRPVIQGTTRFVPTKHEFLFQINPQTIKNGTPIVNWSDPSIWLKNGGRIAKYQKAGWIGKGLKWLTTKADDAIKSVQRTHAIKSFNKGITQSKTAYQFNPITGSFNFVVEKPFDHKFKHFKDLSDSKIKVLFDDLKTSGVVIPNPHHITFTQVQPSKGSYVLFERPSKLTKAELAGIPRGERSSTNKPSSYMADWLKKKSDKSFRVSQRNFNAAIDNDEKLFLEAIDEGDINDSNFYSKYYEWFKSDYMPVSKGYDTSDKIAKRYKRYAEQLGDIDIHPMYETVSHKYTGEIENPFMVNFRKYLQSEGIDQASLSTKDLQKILTVAEQDVNRGVTGKFKNIPLGHASPESFESFNFPHTLGQYTKNSGAYGPGNYFYAYWPSTYGGKRQILSQPFYATGIESVLSREFAEEKKLINKYLSGSFTVDDIFYPKNGKFATISGNLESKTDFPSIDQFGRFFDGQHAPVEVAIPKNMGIKSLFPHPSRFVEQSDGTIKFLPTDWNDPRFNFKNGGKIEKHQKGKIITKLFKQWGDDVAKYTSGVKKRTAEAIIRIGDDAESIPGLVRQMASPTTIKYIFNPKRSELAYQLPYKYSGLSALKNSARPGDVVDIFLGKTTVPNDIAVKDLPLEIQSYLSKNYPGRKIITRRLGNTSKNISLYQDYGQLSLLPGQSKKLKGNFNSTNVIINGTSVLDPGGYNIYATRLGDDLILDAYDIWKFKSADYSKQYGTNIRGIGLNFIDSQGNPIVSTWQDVIPGYFSQELKLKPFEPYIPTLKDKLQKHWNRYFGPIIGAGVIGGGIYGVNKVLEQLEQLE